MSYLSPVDSAQVYFEPLDVDDETRTPCSDDDDRNRLGYPSPSDRDDQFRAGWSERADRLEDMRERFEDFRERGGAELRDRDDWHEDRCEDNRVRDRFEQFERGRLEDAQGAHPLPRL